MPAGEDVWLEVALGGGYVDALGAVPALRGARHLTNNQNIRFGTEHLSDTYTTITYKK